MKIINYWGKLLLCVSIMVEPIVMVSQPLSKHNLEFNELPTVWDEGIPLGNGFVGTLIWNKDDKLRMSLDRSDVWDLRPMKGLHRNEFSFKWVEEQVRKRDYKPVQEYLDGPYDREPAPSKIPAAALEFILPSNKQITKVTLDISKALCSIRWNDGSQFESFVHADKQIGWFKFTGFQNELSPELIAPQYQGELKEGNGNSVLGDDLVRLGYKEGVIHKNDNSITYRQPGWGGFEYEVHVRWERINNTTIEGAWSISSHYSNKEVLNASEIVQGLWNTGYNRSFQTHVKSWKNYWGSASIGIPNEILEKQWYLETYKFGSVAKKGAPPISLQAVWTADNGRIPPWKGDYHHDLNTQLSYWPSYSGNKLDEASGFIDHLEENKDNYERYTKMYFGVTGLAVPGVTTLDGTEMGGWIQYSLSPTVSAWLAQHYYWQWKYSMDIDFLKQKAYPWFNDVCVFLENLTFLDANGVRKLPISSSPEIYDNKINAWFLKDTNHDLSLMKYAFSKGIELAKTLGHNEKASHWENILNQFPNWALTDKNELMFAPDFPYNESHRHFSHLMAIYPLGLIKWDDGKESEDIINNSLTALEKIGPSFWAGYSYAWLGNLYAQAKNGEKAEQALTTFAQAFCLPNSFHANGDQTKSGLSNYTYRPFTLEGNLAFANGIQQMLVQSYENRVSILPAVPSSWKDISFNNIRTEGAFLISLNKEKGKVKYVKIESTVGGDVQLMLPSPRFKVVTATGVKVTKEINASSKMNLSTSKGGILVLQEL